MKRLTYLFFAVLMMGCQPKSEPAETAQEEAPAPVMAYFGAQITEDGAVNSVEIPDRLAGMDSIRVKVIGSIDKVCQAKGCWMTMRVNDEQTMHVSFKDYGFFVPKDIDGKEAIIDGYAYIETQSVDELRHYAEDAGKSQEEIDAITEPELNLSFVADGVIVMDYQINTTEEVEESADELEDHAEHNE